MTGMTNGPDPQWEFLPSCFKCSGVGSTRCDYLPLGSNDYLEGHFQDMPELRYAAAVVELGKGRLWLLGGRPAAQGIG